MRANQWITSVSIVALGALLSCEPGLAQCTGLTCYHDSRRLVRAIKVINFEQTAAYQGAHVALALGRGLPCLVHF